MGQITSGVGLISGINTAQLIEQLLALEARPKSALTSRNTVLQSQNVAYQEINAKLLALKLDSSGFISNKIFQSTSVTSSNEDVVTATSGPTAPPGTYNFVVSRLVGTQQEISQGFGDIDTTPFAGGTVTFESGAAKLEANTSLTQLNGGTGVQRGKIRVTDASGATAVVDLSKALTVNDVIDAINNTSGISVAARVNGDRFEIADTSGGLGSLAVANVGITTTATGLGLATGVYAAGVLSGGVVNRVGSSTVLATLNDGNGVHIKGNDVGDFRVTRQDGTTFDVSLSGASTIGQVITKINTASGGNVTASVNDSGTGIKLVDSTGGGGALSVAALNSSNAAADLGLTNTAVGSTLDGGRLLAGLNSKLVRNLKGGAGVGLGTISVTNRAGVNFAVDLSGASSVSDIITAINTAGAANSVSASLNSAGNGINLTDATGATASNFIVADSSGTAAADLGLAQSVADTTVKSSNLQLKYIAASTRRDSLNGGLGVAKGKFRITDSNGASADIDLSQGDEVTVADILNEINSRGLALNARINDNGDGILIEDNGTGGSAIKVTELGSTTARDLGLLGEADTAGADLDGSFEKRIVVPTFTPLTAATTLASLNGGDGVENVAGLADFTVTRADGTTFDVDLDGALTVQDVLTAINTASGGNVTASIGSGGAGLQLVDTTGGSGTVKATALNNSGAAADLGLGSTATYSSGTLRGANLVEATTLQDLVEKINEAGVGVRATIINDGSPANPYRLSLIADKPGKAGAFILDDGGLGLGNFTLNEAQDAVVFYGGSDPASAVAVSSTTNTLNSLIPGATVNLVSASENPVSVTITRDDSKITESVKKFVDDFNVVIAALDKYDSYDAENKKRGLLLGDNTIARVRSGLFRLVSGRNNEVGTQFNALTQIGIKVGSGAKLQFDEAKFKAALETDRNAVEQLFTFKTTEADDEGVQQVTAAGIGVRIDELLKSLTDSTNGALQGAIDNVQDQVELNNDRIAQIDKKLEAKRLMLQTQFNQMEKALAKMQGQGSSLGSLAALAAQSGSVI